MPAEDYRMRLKQISLKRMLAETEGFEPSVPVNPVRRFSKPLVSATHPRLRLQQMRGYSEGRAAGQRL